MNRRHNLPGAGLLWRKGPGEEEIRREERECVIDGTGRKREDRAI